MIAPNIGELKSIKARMPHPNGFVDVELTRVNSKLEGEVNLPKGTSGTFIWEENEISLKEGSQKISLMSSK